MAVLNAMLLAILGKEAVGQADRLALWLLNKAIVRVAQVLRPQYSVEWLAHFEECPGPISKSWHAVGCWFAAPRVQFDPISLIERLACSAAGVFYIIFEFHRLCCRAKACNIIRCLILLRRFGLSETHTHLHRRRACALVRYSRIEKGVIICLSTFAGAGLRAGKHADCTDAVRAWLISYASRMTCVYLKWMLIQQGDLAIFRNTIGITKSNRLAYRGTDQFEKLVSEGLKMRESIRIWSKLIAGLNELFDLLASKAEGESFHVIQRMRVQLMG